jgi:predicted Zn-dependent peptidase
MFNLSKLNNNLRVISSHMPGLRSVNINILTKVGSRYENENEHGICHFLEHMIFKGTKKRTYKQIAQEFDDMGGQFNAYTSKEYTVYYAKVLTEHMPKAFDIFGDILQNSLFASEEIEKERRVVLQEIAQTQDSPDDLAYDNLVEAAFDKQPLGKSVLGTSETLATFNTASFQNYINKYYHSNNMIVSVAGNVEHNHLVKLCEEVFSNLPYSTNDTHKPASYTHGSKLVTKDLEQVNIVLGFESPSYIDKKKSYKAQVLALILGGGISSKLFQNIREKHGLVYSVGSFNNAYSDAGVFCIHGSTTPENVNNFIREVHTEVKNICNDISELELSRAKEQIKTNMVMAEEKASYRSEDLAKSFAIFGEYITLDEILQQVNAFSTADILESAREIFTTRPVLSAVGPDLKLDYMEIVEQFKKL